MTTGPITSFEDNFSLGYPHTNAFSDGGTSFQFLQRTDSEVSLWKFDAASLSRQRLCLFERSRQPEKLLWSDTAIDAGIPVTIADNILWQLPRDGSGSPKRLYQPPENHSLNHLPSIRRDGKKCLVLLHHDGTYTARLVDTETGESSLLFGKKWWANHIQFSPFDPSWIGFCHEGPCSTIPDRVWAWHPEQAPGGNCMFDQMYHQQGKALYAGHERWSFHDRSILIVAYGEGPDKPRGIYEAFPDGRPQKLISEGDRDSHVDISRDGRWVVVDTTGPHDQPGKGWEDAWPVSDIIVIDKQTGERRFAARTRMNKHPSHPHPVFTPDGKTVFYNECDETGELNRVCTVPNPFL